MLDIVIVTHNSEGVLAGCLQELRDVAPASITVVDSGSRSTAYLDALPSAHRVLREPNVGYGTAADIGFAAGSAPWLALLNPDVRVDGATLGRLVAHAEEVGAAAVGPVLRDHTGEVQDYPYRAMTPYWRRRSSWGPLAELGTCRESEVLNGSVLVMRRDAFTTVGGFDPAFFLYAEEDDLMTRLRASGCVVARDQAVEAVHIGEGGSGDIATDWRTGQRIRGRFQYLRKHYSLVEACLAMGMDLARSARRRGLGATVRAFTIARHDPRTGTPADTRRREVQQLLAAVRS